MPFTANYHTHTFRCHHASGDAIDYARIAVAGGCKVLGISDHAPMPDGRWINVRMAMEELDAYEAAISAAQATHPQLTMLVALECEHLDENESFYRDELLGRRGYDYLIGACHYSEIEGAWRSSFEGLSTVAKLQAYAKQCIRTMRSGLFAFIAHPDIIGCSNAEWSEETAACARDICAASAALEVPLELNAYGIRKPWIQTADGKRPTYPWPPFWEIAAEEGALVVLNSDAHRPQDVLAGYDELAAIRDRYGLREADLGRLVAAPKLAGGAAGGVKP